MSNINPPQRLKLPLVRGPDVLETKEGGALVPIQHPDDAGLPGDELLHHALPGARAGQVGRHLHLT